MNTDKSKPLHPLNSHELDFGLKRSDADRLQLRVVQELE